MKPDNKGRFLKAFPGEELMTGGLGGTEISSNISFGKVNCRLLLQIKLT